MLLWIKIKIDQISYQPDDMEKIGSQNYFVLSKAKFYGILLSAILSSIVATAVLTVRTLNSDHFSLLALVSRVDRLEKDYVPRNEYNDLIGRLDRVQGQLTTLINLHIK